MVGWRLESRDAGCPVHADGTRGSWKGVLKDDSRPSGLRLETGLGNAVKKRVWKGKQLSPLRSVGRQLELEIKINLVAYYAFQSSG